MEQSMSPAWWLLFAVSLLSVWNLGIVWFTHIAVYPLWPLVDARHFEAYHLAWWRYMRPSFAPVALMLLGTVALFWIRPQGVSTGFLLLGVALQVAVHTLTIFYWAPIQASMGTPEGISRQKYHQLMGTHWWRVGFFAAFAVLMVWMVSRSLNHVV